MDLIQIAASSLHADGERLNLIANNLANVTTAGYKRSFAVQAQDFAGVIDQAMTKTSSIPIGVSLSRAVDFSDGALRPTGRSLDISVGTDTFLELRTPTGLVYSRGGSFSVDAQGRVVLGDATLQLLDGDFKLTDPAQRVSINEAGLVRNDEREVGQLRLVRFDDASRMKSLGSGMYEAGSAQVIKDSATPMVRSGFLEASNVQSAQEMVKLMETTRHFEAMQKVVQAYDEVLGTAVRKLGEF